MLSPIPLSRIQDRIQTGSMSLVQLTQDYLNNIKGQASLNTFLEVYEQEALDKALQVEQKIQEGKAGRLAGLVLGVKDVFSYQGHPLQCASKILSDFQAQYTATSLQRLLDEDAIVLGRQNCDEFAMGSANQNSAFGPVKNPHKPAHAPGGSSGGSAAAVAADQCQASLGSDTGGSVRQPAAYCGVIGLKPSYGRISRYGLTAYASSFDTVGILSQHLEDAARMLSVMAGADSQDATCSLKSVPPYEQFAAPPGPYKIAYFQDTFDHEGLDPQIRQGFLEVLKGLERQGNTVEAISFQHLAYILPVYYILTMAEASSNLARYDGVRYGFRGSVENSESGANNLEAMYKHTRSQGFGKEVIRRILLGTFILSADYYEAYYLQAQKVRRMIAKQTQEILQRHDFILSPTAPSVAPLLDQSKQDPLQEYLNDIYTVHANLCGLPAISLPMPPKDTSLPWGIQATAGAFEEDNLLTFSKYILDKV